MASEVLRVTSSDSSTSERRRKCLEEENIEALQGVDYGKQVDARSLVRGGVQSSSSCNFWSCCSGIRCCSRVVIVVVNETDETHEILSTKKVAATSIQARKEEYSKISKSFFYFLARKYGSSLSYLFLVAVKYLHDPDKSHWSSWIQAPFEYSEPLFEGSVKELIQVLDIAKGLFDEMREKKMKEDIKRIIFSGSPGSTLSSASAGRGSEKPEAMFFPPDGRLPAASVDHIVGGTQRMSLGTVSESCLRRVETSAPRADSESLCNFIDDEGHLVRNQEDVDAKFLEDDMPEALKSRPLDFKVRVGATLDIPFRLEKLQTDIISLFDCDEGTAKQVSIEVRDEVRYYYLTDTDTIVSQIIYDKLTEIALRRGLKVREEPSSPVLDLCIQEQRAVRDEISEAMRVDDISHEAFAALLRGYNSKQRRPKRFQAVAQSVGHFSNK